MEALLGDELLTAGGVKPTAEVLKEATAVGLYFSAHWCPPCRGATPKLAQVYKDTFKEKGLRMIFVSSDKDEASFKDYFKEMPWDALPFVNREKKDALSKKYKVKGIPTLVILDPDGKTLTTEGLKAMLQDSSGKDYPYHPPTKEQNAEALKEVLKTHNLLDKVEGKHIGLYFSAHWCPPCRGFTPKLAEFYNKGLKDKMEIIFVSGDRDKASFDSYSKEMPWLSIPWGQDESKAKLNKLFPSDGIPSLAICGPDGVLITMDGRSQVMSDPTGAKLPDGWRPQPFNDINEDPSDMSEEKCVIALGADADQVAAVKAHAEEQHLAAGKDVAAMPVRFFFAPEGRVAQQIRKHTNIEAPEKVVILMDDPAGEVFYVKPPDSSVKDFIADVAAGKVEQKKLEKKRPFDDITEDSDPINEEKCVIALGGDADQVAALKAEAKEQFEAVGKDVAKMKVRFYTAPEGGLTQQVRKLTGIEGNAIIFMDIPAGGAFYVKSSTGSVKDFVSDVFAGKAEKKQLSRG